VSTFLIRQGRLPDDEALARSFITGLQAFEKAMEPDRRLDPTVAGEFLAVLASRIAERQGRIYIGEDGNGAAVGWACCFIDENEVYVEAELRRFGLISELFVVEAARGRGVGRALIAACESYFRTLKLRSMMIGVLAKNDNARRMYFAAGFRPYSEQLQKML
jgi:GNAT superfamily N-acetyltransferase